MYVLFSENIVLAHKYSKDETHAAASAVNAGTDLEDGNLPVKLLNTFANLEDAVNQVSIATGIFTATVIPLLYIIFMLVSEFL